MNIPAEYGHDEHKDHGHHGETYRTATEDEIDSGIMILDLFINLSMQKEFDLFIFTAMDFEFVN